MAFPLLGRCCFKSKNTDFENTLLARREYAQGRSTRTVITEQDSQTSRSQLSDSCRCAGYAVELLTIEVSVPSESPRLREKHGLRVYGVWVSGNLQDLGFIKECPRQENPRDQEVEA